MVLDDGKKNLKSSSEGPVRFRAAGLQERRSRAVVFRVWALGRSVKVYRGPNLQAVDVR